jgi:hypothetical protein
MPDAPGDGAVAAFRRSVVGGEPPHGLSLPLMALWWDLKGDWERAHACAQGDESAAGSWVHAFLHRREGDLANAAYWYRRAGKPMPGHGLDEEWTTIAGTLLASG